MDNKPLAFGLLGLGLYLWWQESQANIGAGFSITGAAQDFQDSLTNSVNQLINPAQNVENAMEISQNGLNFIMSQEGGPYLTPYADAGGYSIGYGHYMGTSITIPSITAAQAQALLLQDVQVAEDTINQAVTVALTQNQFDALCDFVYNEGATQFESSTLLADINAGNFNGATLQFARWDLSQGNVLTALVNRRAAEAQLFNT